LQGKEVQEMETEFIFICQMTRMGFLPDEMKLIASTISRKIGLEIEEIKDGRIKDIKVDEFELRIKASTLNEARAKSVEIEKIIDKAIRPFGSCVASIHQKVL